MRASENDASQPVADLLIHETQTQPWDPERTAHLLPAPDPEPRRRHPVARLVATTFKTLIAMLVITELVAVSFIWFTPTRTSFMLQNQSGPIAYQFVSLDHISRYMIAATIAHEDEDLGSRLGAFSFTEFKARAVAHLDGGEDPSGSTIPQQLVKNIFLWPGQSGFRKGLEAVLATQYSLTLSDQRIMELYLNYAQFGPRLYGICAASWYYFGTPPYFMNEYQAAQLMGVLPLPSKVERAPGGGILLDSRAHPGAWNLVNGAANVHVPRQIAGMGGWKSAVGTIGISDSASDYADERLPGASAHNMACTSYPEDVVDLLREQGVEFDSQSMKITKDL